MLFNSYIFIFIFLPIVLLGWYGLNFYKKYKLANLFLAGMSLWFYGYFNLYYLTIILVSIGLNYALSRLLTRIPADDRHTLLFRRTGLLAGVVLNLGILFYFKYYDFFIENINFDLILIAVLNENAAGEIVKSLAGYKEKCLWIQPKSMIDYFSEENKNQKISSIY